MTSRLSHTRFIIIGFFIIILGGSLLLMLPSAAAEHCTTPYIRCLFTSVSATCVTGLNVMDTFSYWSLFGQLVILVLIQIGGLGFVTIGVFFRL